LSLVLPARSASRSHALLNPSAFKLGDRRQDVQLERAGWRRRVDAFGQADERDAERAQLVEHRDEVAEIATKSVQAPDDQNIEPPPPRVSHHRVECWPALLRA
jgi:hypothetical protein